MALIHQAPTPHTNHLNTNVPAPTGNPKMLSIPNLSNHDWILDSKATNHMYHSNYIFSHLIEIKSIPISLPNGASVQTFYSGILHFNEYLYLGNVFFILVPI